MVEKESTIKSFCNKQIDGMLPELIRSSGFVHANGHLVKLTISPVSDSVNLVTGLSYVLDVEDYAFFYENAVDAILDQVKLCDVMRRAGIIAAKVIKSNPLTLN